MAIGDAYATAAEYRAVTGMVDTSQDTAILNSLKSISRHVEFKCRRFFNKDSADQTRIYVVPADCSTLWIDDMSAAPTSIKIDEDLDGTYETTLAATDFELWPLNALLEPEPRPYMQICLTPWGDRAIFSKGERVQVIGKFGWPAVPESIKQATIHLAAILRLESPRATTRIPEMGDVIGTSPEAQHILRQIVDKYKRRNYQ